VERNRAKRRLREVIRKVGLPGGHDVVIVAGESTPRVPFVLLSSWFSQAINQLMKVDRAKEGPA
jgi:ribonuclease P protein component